MAIGTRSSETLTSASSAVASIGQGMTVGIANSHVTAAQRDLCDKLMSTAGKIACANEPSLLALPTAKLSIAQRRLIFVIRDGREADDPGIHAEARQPPTDWPRFGEPLDDDTMAAALELLGAKA